MRMRLTAEGAGYTEASDLRRPRKFTPDADAFSGPPSYWRREREAWRQRAVGASPALKAKYEQRIREIDELLLGAEDESALRSVLQHEHPDKGGDREKFEAATKALKARRARR